MQVSTTRGSNVKSEYQITKRKLGVQFGHHLLHFHAREITFNKDYNLKKYRSALIMKF